MRILFLGGTGLISSAVSPLLVERGHDLTLANRGTSPKASAPANRSRIWLGSAPGDTWKSYSNCRWLP